MNVYRFKYNTSEDYENGYLKLNLEKILCNTFIYAIILIMSLLFGVTKMSTGINILISYF